MTTKRAKEFYTLADLRRWDKIDRPIRLGVFGDPVERSLSSQIQNAALEACKIQMQYARFQIVANELEEAVQLIRTLHFVGVNLTAPHKIAACAFVDEIEENAKRRVGLGDRSYPT